MVKFNENDFVEVDFDIYADGKLVNSTDKKIGEGNKEEIKFKPMVMVLGKAFILKAFDDEILRNGKVSGKLVLKSGDAYGFRNPKFIKTFPKRVFDEKKIRAVVGATYDFNGNFGRVISIVSSRVRVDFNNPNAGKNIIIEYKNLKIVEDIKIKLETILTLVLKIPNSYFEILVKKKKVIIKIPNEIMLLKEQFIKTFEDFILEFKNFEIEFNELVVKK